MAFDPNQIASLTKNFSFETIDSVVASASTLAARLSSELGDTINTVVQGFGGAVAFDAVATNTPVLSGLSPSTSL